MRRRWRWILGVGAVLATVVASVPWLVDRLGGDSALLGVDAGAVLSESTQAWLDGLF